MQFATDSVKQVAKLKRATLWVIFESSIVSINSMYYLLSGAKRNFPTFITLTIAKLHHLRTAFHEKRDWCWCGVMTAKAIDTAYATFFRFVVSTTLTLWAFHLAHKIVLITTYRHITVSAGIVCQVSLPWQWK